MRTANYVLSTISLVLGLATILLVMTQADEFRVRTLAWPPDWSAGTAFGVVLFLNGAVRLWFLAGDANHPPPDGPYTP